MKQLCQMVKLESFMSNVIDHRLIYKSVEMDSFIKLKEYMSNSSVYVYNIS